MSKELGFYRDKVGNTGKGESFLQRFDKEGSCYVTEFKGEFSWSQGEVEKALEKIKAKFGFEIVRVERVGHNQYKLFMYEEKISPLKSKTIMDNEDLLTPYYEECARRAGATGSAHALVGFSIDQNNEGTPPIYLNFGDSPHIKVVGGSGSGKTKTVLSLLWSISRSQPKSRFLVADGKKTITSQDFEFMATFISTHNVAGEGGEVFGSQINQFTKEIKNIWDERNLAFDLRSKREGVSISSREGYNRCNREGDEFMEPVFVIIDEASTWASTIKESEKYPGSFGFLLIQAIKKVRSFGISFIFISQRPTDKDIPTAISSNLHYHFIHRVQKQDSNNLEMPEAEGLKTGTFIFKDTVNGKDTLIASPFIGDPVQWGRLGKEDAPGQYSRALPPQKQFEEDAPILSRGEKSITEEPELTEIFAYNRFHLFKPWGWTPCKNILGDYIFFKGTIENGIVIGTLDPTKFDSESDVDLIQKEKAEIEALGGKRFILYVSHSEYAKAAFAKFRLPIEALGVELQTSVKLERSAIVALKKNLTPDIMAELKTALTLDSATPVVKMSENAKLSHKPLELSNDPREAYQQIRSIKNPQEKGEANEVYLVRIKRTYLEPHGYSVEWAGAVSGNTKRRGLSGDGGIDAKVWSPDKKTLQIFSYKMWADKNNGRDVINSIVSAAGRTKEEILRATGNSIQVIPVLIHTTGLTDEARVEADLNGVECYEWEEYLEKLETEFGAPSKNIVQKYREASRVSEDGKGFEDIGGADALRAFAAISGCEMLTVAPHTYVLSFGQDGSWVVNLKPLVDSGAGLLHVKSMLQINAPVAIPGAFRRNFIVTRKGAGATKQLRDEAVKNDVEIMTYDKFLEYLESARVLIPEDGK
ncbi:MAG: hypothetical protein H7318_14195 [Oligoflexus sp.]|nr:hypothetical protein [Oligoflexus sp.]